MNRVNQTILQEHVDERHPNVNALRIEYEYPTDAAEPGVYHCPFCGEPV